MTVLRRQAKKAGFSINSRPDVRGGDGRRYSLVDRATKTIVTGGIPDLDTLATELLSRIRERTDPGQGVVHEDLSLGSCPDCGTRRIGAFRYCRSCGRDFEPLSPSAQVPQVPAWRPAFSLNVETAASSDPRPSGVEAAAVLSPARVRRQDDPRVGDTPMTATRSDRRPQMASVGSTMQIVIALGIGIGVGVGALVPLLLSALQH